MLISGGRKIMDKQQALVILRALAEGVDPHTGEIFDSDSPYQHPQTIRALFFAISTLEKQKTRNELPQSAGKAWTEKEDKDLCASFDQGMAVKQLAQKHQRTLAAIKTRLIRLGKLNPLSLSNEEAI